jgi:hypothetical protein
VTGQSTVTDALTNGGPIAFQWAGAFTTVTTINYVGNGGTINFNTALAGDGSSTDQLIINGGTATGTTGVLVTNQGGPGAAVPGHSSGGGWSAEEQTYYLRSHLDDDTPIFRGEGSLLGACQHRTAAEPHRARHVPRPQRRPAPCRQPGAGGVAEAALTRLHNAEQVALGVGHHGIAVRLAFDRRTEPDQPRPLG